MWKAGSWRCEAPLTAAAWLTAAVTAGQSARVNRTRSTVKPFYCRSFSARPMKQLASSPVGPGRLMRRPAHRRSTMHHLERRPRCHSARGGNAASNSYQQRDSFIFIILKYESASANCAMLAAFYSTYNDELIFLIRYRETVNWWLSWWLRHPHTADQRQRTFPLATHPWFGTHCLAASSHNHGWLKIDYYAILIATFIVIQFILCISHHYSSVEIQGKQNT